MIGARVGIYSGKGIALTARTTAFIAATGITDAIIINALNNFDLGLILNGIDTKFKAIYPMVGGSATTHKFNFMNPVDSDAAFRLTFNGGWTHSSTGAKPNGTNAYAQTHIVQSVEFLQTNMSFGFYSRTNTNAGVDIGAFNTTSRNWLIARQSGNFIRYIGDNLGVSISNADSLGLHWISSNGSVTNSFKNATSLVSGTHGSVDVAIEYYIGGSNNIGSASQLSAREHSFTFFAEDLTSTATVFSNLVTDFQTALSRNV